MIGDGDEFDQDPDFISGACEDRYHSKCRWDPCRCKCHAQIEFRRQLLGEFRPEIPVDPNISIGLDISEMVKGRPVPAPLHIRNRNIERNPS